MSIPDTAIRSVHDVLRMHEKARGAETAVTDAATRLTYRQLSEKVDEVACGLLALGVKHGDRVATLANPGLDFWLTYLATTSIGAIWLGLNPKYRSSEITHILNDAEPRLVLIQPEIEDRDYLTELTELGCPTEKILSFSHNDSIRNLYELCGHSDVARGTAGLSAARSSVSPEDTAVIVYTSGTTGRPKGAMLSHRAVVASARINSEWMHPGLSSTICFAPINHVGALNNRCMVVLYAGGKISFRPKPDFASIAGMVDSEGCSFFHFNPTTLSMLLEYPASAEAVRARSELVLIGGGVIPEDLLHRLDSRRGRIVNVYGQTETTGIILRTDFGADPHVIANTIGKPIEECDVRIAGARTGHPEIVGEIEVRGPVMMSGYFRRPEATADAFTPDGWLKTGDAGRLDKDGNLVFVGRLKEMFKSGGYNVYPAEIELTLAEHDDVQSAVIVPVTNALYQEVGHAFVCLAPGAPQDAEALKAFLRSRLANYKIPKSISFVTEFPLLPSMKVDRNAMKELANRIAER